MKLPKDLLPAFVIQLWQSVEVGRNTFNCHAATASIGFYVPFEQSDSFGSGPWNYGFRSISGWRWWPVSISLVRNCPSTVALSAWVFWASESGY